MATGRVVLPPLYHAHQFKLPGTLPEYEDADDDGEESDCPDSKPPFDENWNTYNFEWLFDPTRLDHLPIEEQILYYKRRDLQKGKIFKLAAKIWGPPLSRKRVIIAPPMPKKADYENETKDRFIPIAPPRMNAELRPQQPPEVQPSEEELHDRVENAKIDSYKNWVNDRKNFRTSLENMGLNEDWLTNKPNKTPLEQRVLRRMIEEKNPRIPTPPPVVVPSLDPILPETPPIIQRPSPLAIKIIERFLYDNKMRLIDLFSTVDKNKNWRISRDEFRKAIQEAGIPISEVLLEDLIMALDTDLNNELDYRELAKGMGLWKVEKRESKRKMAYHTSSLTPSKYSLLAGFEVPKPAPSEQWHSFSEPALPADRIKSALSTISSGSSQYLEPPETDVRPAQYLLSSGEAMVDRRKRERETLAKANGKKQPLGADGEVQAVLKTGDPMVDANFEPSTLGGEVAAMIDMFRQTKYQEYLEVVKLCKDQGVQLNEPLLQKVLLFPPDKSHASIKRHIRQPGNDSISLPSRASIQAGSSWRQSSTSPSKDKSGSHSYKGSTPQPGKGSPWQKQERGGSRLSKSGRGETDTPHSETYRQLVGRTQGSRQDAAPRQGGEFVGTPISGPSCYPSHRSVAAKPKKVHLSTGKAIISRQVDCWMTFEEYDKLTSQLERKYNQMHGRTDENAFWPGQLLDKLRLYMPVDGGNDEYPRRGNPGYHSDTRGRPAMHSDYVQYACMEPWHRRH